MYHAHTCIFQCIATPRLFITRDTASVLITVIKGYITCTSLNSAEMVLCNVGGVKSAFLKCKLLEMGTKDVLKGSACFGFCLASSLLTMALYYGEKAYTLWRVSELRINKLCMFITSFCIISPLM